MTLISSHLLLHFGFVYQFISEVNVHLWFIILCWCFKIFLILFFYTFPLYFRIDNIVCQ